MFRAIIFIFSVLLCSNVYSDIHSDELMMLIDDIFPPTLQNSSQTHIEDFFKHFNNSKAEKKTAKLCYLNESCTTLQDGLGLCINYYDCQIGLVNTSSEKKEKDDPCVGIMNICCPETLLPNYLKKWKPPINQGCGNSNPMPDSVHPKDFNINKNISAIGEFPWMVAVLRILPIATKRNPKSTLAIYQCGGSLIHPKVVLTGANCVLKLNLSEAHVRVGEWDTQSKIEPLPHQDISVVKIISHERFSEKNLQHNAALLILESEVTNAENVGVICLPPAVSKLPQGHCLMSGWGKDQFGKDGRYQTILKKLQMSYINNTVCNDALRKTRLGEMFQLHKSFICAGGENGIDACNGDGGSPLVCQLQDNEKTYFQYGIVAWGIGCGRSGVPGVYTNVASLRIWIDQQLSDNNIDMDNYTAEHSSADDSTKNFKPLAA